MHSPKYNCGYDWIKSSCTLAICAESVTPLSKSVWTNSSNLSAGLDLIWGTWLEGLGWGAGLGGSDEVGGIGGFWVTGAKDDLMAGLGLGGDWPGFLGLVTWLYVAIPTLWLLEGSAGLVPLIGGSGLGAGGGLRSPDGGSLWDVPLL